MSFDPVIMSQPASVSDVVLAVQTMRNFTEIIVRAIDSNSYREDKSRGDILIEYKHFARKIGRVAP